MEDIIDIIVTETTNTIEITSQGTDEIIDVNIIDNREDIVLNVTPTVVEININSLTGNFGVTWGEITGTLSNQTDLNTALGLKADLVGGKVPSSQLPSYVDDVVEVANYAALPATGETGKIYITLDTNKIYRWSGSAYIEIADSTAVWGAITGTLSSQTDLQSALNAKFDDPTGDTTQYIAGDGSLITFPVAGQSGTLVREVRNTTGATLTKGTIVYISGATGNKPTVSKAIATGDSTSAQTFGMCQANISNNSNGYVVCVGDLGGLDTSALTEGAQLYLSSTTAGTYTTTKQLAPNHLVYIGVVTRAHPTQGQIEVKIQNGYELDEIHDVAISSVANNDGLFYEASTDLWKNKSIATVLGYTPANGANYLPLAGGTMTGAIVGTTATFANSGSGIGLGVTQSGSSGDGIKITHSAGRAFNIQSSGSGYGILINNETASTSIPFLIQKQGATKIGLYDDGSSSFSGTLSAPTINISNSAANNALYITQGNSTYNAVVITNTGGTALYATGAVTVIGTGTYTGVLTAQAGLANGTGQAFTFGTTSGTLAITSQLSSYLPLSGGTLTGALSGTSATFSGDITIGTIGNSSSAYHRGSFNGTNTSANLSTVYFSGGDGSQNRAGLKVYQTWGGTYTDTCVDLFVTKGGVGGTTALSINGLGAATFSGALSGTSVALSGAITTNGTTLSSWGNVLVPALETLNGNSISSYNASNIPAFYFASNAYHNGTSYVRKTANSAVLLSIDGYNNNFQIQTASSSSAGSAISWTQRFNIDGSTGAATFSSSVTATTFSATDSTGSAILTTNGGGEAILSANTANPWRFLINGSERMRITSGGQLLVGTTSTDSGISVDFQNLSSSSSNVLVRAKNTITNEDTGFVISGNSSGTQRDYIIGLNTIVNSSDLTFSGPTGFQWHVGGTVRMRITSGGSVLIGATTGSGKLNITQDQGSNNQYLNFVGTQSGNSQEWGFGIVNNTRDFRLYDYTAGVERFRFLNNGTLAIAGSSDVNNGILDKISIGHLSGSYGWIQTWNATNLYLNKAGNAVYAGTQRIDNNSDARIKSNIQNIENALETVLSLSGKKFNMLDENNILRYGFIAQEVQPHLNDFVTESDRKFEKGDLKIENLLTLESSGSAWGALLVEAIKELKAELDTLKNK